MANRSRDDLTQQDDEGDQAAVSESRHGDKVNDKAPIRQFSGG